MHDYADTPLADKLGLKQGQVVYFLGPPDGFVDSLEPLPEVRIRRRLTGPVDVAIAFTRTRRHLEAAFDRIVEELTPAGGLWIAWPKRASGVRSELDFSAVQRTGLEAGLVDNKSCSIDEVWQALRFVRRLRDRPGFVRAGRR